MKHCLRKFRIIVSFVLIFNVVFYINLYASQDAFVYDVQLKNNRDDLIVYFQIKNAFTDKISEAVLKGVPASFSSHIRLVQVTSNILDTEIADFKITATLKYNILKKQFVVLRPWKSEKPFVTDSFEEAKKLMSEVYNLKVLELSNLVKGEKYKLELKADLDKVTLPLYLHYIFFFVSFWDFETDWNVTKFIY